MGHTSYGTWAVMDGRARHDPDRATVLETCDSHDDAVRAVVKYGIDAVVAMIDDDGRVLIVANHPELNTPTG